MDNRAQISVEYLTLLAIGLLLAGVVLVFSLNLLNLRDGLVNAMDAIRTRVLQV
jgi:uncharacterized protein (UPF0333 family)